MRQRRKARLLIKTEYLLEAGGCKENKAQSSLEYTLVILCIALALLTMQGYIRRAMQGWFKGLVDDFGTQYEPINTSGSYNRTYSSSTNEYTYTFSEEDAGIDFDGDNVISDNVFATESLSILNYDRSNQIGNETVGPIN